jgi:hypothetical protein
MSEEPSEAAKTAIAEELVLNAAVAFAGQTVSAAQQAAQQAAEHVPEALQDVVVRQFWLETATLCLRRIGESYEESASQETSEEERALRKNGARQAAEVASTLEALGDLGLDLLDRVLEK